MNNNLQYFAQNGIQIGNSWLPDFDDKNLSPNQKMITDPMGQWKYPGMNTRIPGNNITMQGVPYPVFGRANTGQQQMMYPGQDYSFPGAIHVDEYPMMQSGGGITQYGPGGSIMDGCPPYFTKNAFGVCVNASGQTFDQAWAFKNIMSQILGEFAPDDKGGPTKEAAKLMKNRIALNQAKAQQQGPQLRVYDESKSRQGKKIYDEQIRLQAQANSDLSQTMGSFTPQQYADYTAPGGAGSIGANTQLAATALPVVSSAIGAVAPYIGPALQTTIAGVPGLTAGNLINAGFAYQGAKNLPNVYNTWGQVGNKPTWGNIGNAAGETAITALDMFPFLHGASKGIPSFMQDVNMFGNWAAKNASGKDLLVAGALSKRLAFGKPRFNVETPAFAKRIDPIGRSSVNVKNDFLKEMSPEEYDQFVKSIYDKIGYAYDQPFVQFKSSKPISFMQGVGIDPNGSQREAMLLKEKFCAPGSECAKSANAVTNRLFTDITGQPFDALGNAHNAWHMEDQMTRNGAINLRGRFPLKVGDRILMGNNVNQSTYIPGFTADPRVRHSGVFAGMHQTPSGDVFPMIFESGKHQPLYLNPIQKTFTGPNTILEVIRPQQFLDDTFGKALVDKNIRYAFRDKPPVANFNSDNPAVQKVLTDSEPFRETIKRNYDITNDEFNELLNSLVSIGAQETKLNGLLPGSKLAKTKIQLQNTLNRFDLLKPIKQGVNLVKQTINSRVLPTDFHLPAYPGASKIEMEAAKYAAENDVPFESAVRQIKSQYKPKPKFSLSTIEPSKGLFRQKYQTETDRLSNFGSDIKSKNSIENALGLMSENYNKVKNMYPDATPRQLIDITTLMWNSPGKALNTELVDFYVFGKNNPNPTKFNFDYINKVNKFKDRYINVKPQLVDPHYDILQNGKYPVIQYAQGGQPPVNPNGMYDGGLLSKTVTCSKCGWSWKGVDGGEDVMTCHKCGGNIKMKQGGELTPEELASLNRAKMKSKMALASEFGNPSAKRMTSVSPSSYRFTGNEMIGGRPIGVHPGETGTHFMSSMGNYAVPFIQQDANGKIIFNPNASFRDREAIRFDNPEDAQYFAEHYKEVAPMMQNFAMGGSLPGSVGFIYARTKGIPSEGPYAKKTLPSAQNGLHKKYFPEKVNNWVEPKYVEGLNSEGHYGYNGRDTINYDPNSEVENINNPWWLEHEKYHHFQTLSGRNPKERRQQEVDNQVNEMIKSNPELQFIPKSKLISGSKPNEKGQKSFIGAGDLIYENPSTLEGEARLYEDYISSGGKSIFPKQENGGDISIPQLPNTMSYFSKHGIQIGSKL